MVRATIRKKDGTEETRTFWDFADLGEWEKENWGTYTKLEAESVAPDEIRQGRE